jgi:hypothetical protein
MTGELGGWLWLLIDVLMVLALGGAIIYGMVAYRRYRNRVPVEQQDENIRRHLSQPRPQK